MFIYKRVILNGKERVAVFKDGEIDYLLRDDEIANIEHLIEEE